MPKHILPYLLFIIWMQVVSAQSIAQKPNTYYIHAEGDDDNDGSFAHPWKTIGKVNSLHFKAGDVIFFHGGNVFSGTLHIKKTEGSKAFPITIQSYGTNEAVIDAKDSSAIIIDNCSHIVINGLTLKGSGRKEGNIKDGLAVINSSYIYIAHIDASGFQKSGLLILDSKHVDATDIYAHDNGYAGIYISGEYGDKLHCRNISICNSHAENNPGDPTNFGNHSGNGILAGFCTGILIDHCTANNNGWDMPRKGNGPVGIWCYEADSVVIQHCLSYRNKTSQGGEDGGGYDFDGGTTNSVIQYCLSYENQGSAFGIFQYDGATPWHDNIIRWCISENDGSVSAAHASAYVWNSSHDSSQLKDLLFYNNTLYNETGNAIAWSSESEHSRLFFYNNIFVAKKDILRGDYSKDVFLGNDWWSLEHGFLVDSITAFRQWAKRYGKEWRSKPTGQNTKPTFKSPGRAGVTSASGLSSFTGYQFTAPSLVKLPGINLERLFNINNGGKDFNELPAKMFVAGACSK